MKKGNQFFLEIQLFDKENNFLDIQSVKKVQFNIDELTKTYDGTLEEVTYNEDDHKFLIWLTENETFEFSNNINIEARILFKNDVILGTEISQVYFHNCIKEIKLDDKVEDIE